MISIGLSSFFLANSTREMGQSYTTLSPKDLMDLVKAAWSLRTPGTGETGIDRKVLVPLDMTATYNEEFGITLADHFFCQPRAKLVAGMPLRAEVVERQK
jgi:hypothetical protein